MSVSANEDIVKAFQKAADGLAMFVSGVFELIKEVSKGLTELAEKKRGLLKKAETLYLIQSCSNRRIAHLALFGKKARTRKKNINRIKREHKRTMQ